MGTLHWVHRATCTTCTPYLHLMHGYPAQSAWEGCARCIQKALRREQQRSDESFRRMSRTRPGLEDGFIHPCWIECPSGASILRGKPPAPPRLDHEDTVLCPAPNFRWSPPPAFDFIISARAPAAGSLPIDRSPLEDLHWKSFPPYRAAPAVTARTSMSPGSQVPSCRCVASRVPGEIGGSTVTKKTLCPTLEPGPPLSAIQTRSEDGFLLTASLKNNN
jgi:hypothetical protein